MSIRIPRASARSSGSQLVRTRRGIALLTVMLVAIVGGVIALASAMMVMGGTLVQASSDRAAAVDDAALSGLEEARNRLNAKLDSIPTTGYRTVESNVSIANTNGVKRTTWVARIGNADSLANAGEFGVQGEIVSQAVDASGNVAIRRSLVSQQSFAKYAYFTDQSKLWDGSILWFANGWTAQGPLHSNDSLYIFSGTPPQAIFKDVVTTAKGVYNKPGGQFNKGPAQEFVAPIALPSTADLNILKTIAAKAGYVFTPTVVSGDSALVTMRIEFVAIDVDGDGNTTGPDDGYFRVYQVRAASAYGMGYAMARTPAPPGSAPTPGGGAGGDSTLFSYNCGVTSVVAGRTAVAATFAAIPVVAAGANYRAKMLNKQNAYDNVNAKCFLGGDERLKATGLFTATDAAGDWLVRSSGSVPAAVSARLDGAYLWPLSARYNPNFRGVIFVEGRAGISGVVRGRVTIASRNNTVVLHDLQQSVNPGTTSGSCKPDDDIVGVFSGENVLWADNMLNAPQQRRDNSTTGAAWLLPRKDFNPSATTSDLVVHATALALKSIGTERPSPPAGLATTNWVNRGFVRQVGGRIQSRAGQGGTISGTALHGYTSDISFNKCALNYPPPYFPTTGRWSLSQFYEINPQNFNAATWFSY
ncbi:MAG: hypothetical protein IPP90_01805 [Gemmatimonadaceae bacterium]|nr:hypothetical protein [Gemmatimonadaceae bacterium]